MIADTLQHKDNLNATSSAFLEIEHFFVLMLENRSFDHLLGCSGLYSPGRPTIRESCPSDFTTSPRRLIPPTCNATDGMDVDVPHEFHDVWYQMTGNKYGALLHRILGVHLRLPMNGFAASAKHGLLRGENDSRKARLSLIRSQGEYAMQCQGEDSVPILRQLAERFAVCDRWFSSMPGPTWPNRFFVHAATSGGLDNSPSVKRMFKAIVLNRKYGFDFLNGTIYDKLGDRQWRIYHDDLIPQVLAIRGMARRRIFDPKGHFRRVDNLAADLARAKSFPRYVFIEPTYDALNDGYSENSQHPVGLVSAGEILIKKVYEAIRKSSFWRKSALVITYDEHGGFFDRVSPPPNIQPPKDDLRNRNEAEYRGGFDFTRLGVRVPAVVISPWVEAGKIDSTVYDHTSILRTVEDRFGLKSLTKRDETANTFSHLFSRSKPRMTPDDAPLVVLRDAPTVPEEPRKGRRSDDRSNDEAFRANEAGFLGIAMSIDALLSERDETEVHIPEITSRAAAREYMNTIAERLGDPPDLDDNQS